ncbi:MAG TPA: nuclear transport factor 2 family protein [Actinopolymorphaceae bacterium]|jgi:hypothetical protein
MTGTTAQPVATAEAYVRFWNLDADAQRALGRTLFADDVAQYAPVGVLAGLDALIDFTTQFAEHMGSYEFRARREPEEHHGRIRVQWELVCRGASFAEGTDVLTLDGQGRIATITTFLDRAPEGFDPHAHPSE